MLYVVATPIGNLGDISIRALEILKNASLIACEDTRQTKKLLTRYNITTSCVRCDSYAQERTWTHTLLPRLRNGEDIALVSDAGTPCVSDPGALLVDRAREDNIDVVPIPGASAVISILSIAGLHGKGFHFEGFLPRKSSARRTRLLELITRDEAFILFESPYRIAKLLAEIADIQSTRHVLLARELTKKFEQCIEGSVQNVCEIWNNAKMAKGECTLLVYPAKKA